eukprot:6532064-Alexandrium_andersonii.AAC.1
MCIRDSVWGPLNDANITRLQAALMRGLRIIAGSPAQGPRSTHDQTDVQVMSQLGVLHVATRIWKARL